MRVSLDLLVLDSHTVEKAPVFPKTSQGNRRTLHSTKTVHRPWTIQEIRGVPDQWQGEPAASPVYSPAQHLSDPSSFLCPQPQSQSRHPPVLAQTQVEPLWALLPDLVSSYLVSQVGLAVPTPLDQEAWPACIAPSAAGLVIFSQLLLTTQEALGASLCHHHFQDLKCRAWHNIYCAHVCWMNKQNNNIWRSLPILKF